VAVVLEAQVAFAGEVFDRAGFSVQFIFVLLTVRAEAGFVELVGVHLGDLLSVDLYGDVRPVAADLDGIPFSRTVGGVLLGGDEIVDRPELVLAGFLPGHDLNLEARVNRVFGVFDAEEDPGVAARIFPADIAFEDEIVELFFVDDDVPAGFVRHQAAVFHGRGDFLSIVAFPPGVVLAVKEQFPAGFFFLGRQLVVRRLESRGPDQNCTEQRENLHVSTFRQSFGIRCFRFLRSP